MALLLTHNDWANRVTGKYVDIDGAHGGQCWDTFADYCISVLGVPPINTWGGTWSGWAYAIWDQYPVNGAAQYFDRIPADQPARAGDVAIWTDRHWYYPASHIAVVLADAGQNVYCMSQNSSAPRPWLPGYSEAATGPNERQYLTKQGLAGYLRRKRILPAATPAPKPAPAPKPKEWDEMATRDDVKAALRDVLKEPAVLDRVALAVLKRPAYLVDPSGKSHKVTGTTTLAKKINYAAHNDAEHTALLRQILQLIDATHPQPAAQPAAELDEALPALDAAEPAQVQA